MPNLFTLEYWIDKDWYVGRLKEVPGVFSQGESLAELEENIQDAFRLMIDSEAIPIELKPQRVIGQDDGLFKVPDDFDGPLADEVLDLFES